MTSTQFEQLMTVLRSIDSNVARVAESCERAELRAASPEVRKAMQANAAFADALDRAEASDPNRGGIDSSACQGTTDVGSTRPRPDAGKRRGGKR